MLFIRCIELAGRRIKEIYEIAVKAEAGVDARAALILRYPCVEKFAQDFESAHLKILQETTSRISKRRIKCARSLTLTQIKLPKITLPKFNGDVSSWPSFYELYNTLIHNNSQLLSIEKYQYLISSLSGETIHVVSNLPLSAEHYRVAYDLLVGRYQNKRRLATHYWNSIAYSKELKSNSRDALQALLDTFEENIRALRLMNFPTESWDFILFNTLLNKISPSLRERFEIEYQKSEIPTSIF